MWLWILLAAAVAYATKAIGVALPENLLERPVVHRITVLLPISLLCALVANQTLLDGRTWAVDARLPALGVATVGLRFKAPFIVVVLLAAGTAALIRAVF